MNNVKEHIIDRIRSMFVFNGISVYKIISQVRNINSTDSINYDVLDNLVNVVKENILK